MVEKIKLNNKIITATIVLYEENFDELSKTIASFLATPFPKKLFLVDNSKIDVLKDKFKHPDIEYLFVGENIGFGKGHNRILDKIKNYSTYHLILNPDVVFEPTLIPELINNFKKINKLALIAPKAVFPNGEHQYTSRRYPTLSELIVRRFPFLKAIFPEIIKKGEYRDKDLSQAFNPDFIHGCFLLFKTDAFIDLKGFDERYFLYMEDVDICRKMDQQDMKKLYFPDVEIVHVLKKKSLKNFKLFTYHTISVFQYFYKWHIKK
ncbi:glycosyltransferase [Aureibaculum luteum]|uniref:glycosyltransferase n=1 Tax=Aureibaculum luteum TaxID=1548456 RepID=UPI001E635295|nr:glycosyltransferase family 2 protein [Aureibaculum luteum]